MSALPPYHVSAYNTAKSSENKIHDDATAKTIVVGVARGKTLAVAQRQEFLQNRAAMRVQVGTDLIPADMHAGFLSAGF